MSFIFKIKAFFPGLFVFPISVFMSLHDILSNGCCFFCDICSIYDGAFFDASSGIYLSGKEKYF